MHRIPSLRKILLLLSLLTFPFFCCGSISLLEALPPSALPPALDFIVNVFEAQAQIENRTAETLYITPITTTYGEPRVIVQPASFRLRDTPLLPNRSLKLSYDSADMPLSGVAVCRSAADCRLLAVDYSNQYSIDSFENLPPLDPVWLQAIEAQPPYNFRPVLFPLLGLLPVILFTAWFYLERRAKKAAA